ncbi:dihydropteroate synthase [Halovenus sp. WSH3]|uniref:dihydropteroate synthase n=1 Tax=Halovenus carboxidivorans TaxID=2692199 RepID=A0A6B0T2F2_9EURY|nr:dihydropteroate synthase [Halovenus carboxidivorans]MXR52244.1 dihydropteroate synthase [Halovenus carboxidivorans]
MRTVDAAGLEIGDDQPPRIMGVLNVSQESPYKPSVFDDPGEAAAYVDEQLIDQGADIVDVGLESANKKFEVLSAEEELERLDTAIETMESVSGDAVFSIETRYHEVAEEALKQGYEMVNDICGFADPEMPRVCEEYDVAVGKMASPPDLERPGAIEDVDDIYDALFQNGLTEKTIIDPAFGGWSEDKTIEDDRETFRRLREFRAIGQPMLVSINRKNFLRSIAGRDTEGALPVSLAATSMAVERGAHIIRTHDVAETRDAALVGDTFTPDRTTATIDGVEVEELDVRTVGDAARYVEEDERELAESGVTAACELRGLDERSLTELRDCGQDLDVAVGGSEPVFVAGSVSAVRALAEAVDDDRLTRSLTAVAEGSR